MTSESVEQTLEALLRRKKTRINTAAYSKEERKVLDEYKEEYQLQTTRHLRAQVFRSKILVGIYNYWKDNDMVPESDEESLDRIMVVIFFKLKKYILVYFNLRNLVLGCLTTGDRRLHWNRNRKRGSDAHRMTSYIVSIERMLMKKLGVC